MIDAVFAMLGGHWTFARSIAPEGIAVRGEASFLADGPAAWGYAETGRLILPGGQSFAASRHYRYRRHGDDLCIDFADGPDTGRTFVTLTFVKGAEGWLEAEATHLCRADTYRVTVRVRVPDAFETVVAVSGPAKSYVATTRYTRPAESDRALPKPPSMA